MIESLRKRDSRVAPAPLHLLIQLVVIILGNSIQHRHRRTPSTSSSCSSRSTPTTPKASFSVFPSLDEEQLDKLFLKYTSSPGSDDSRGSNNFSVASSLPSRKHLEVKQLFSFLKNLSFLIFVHQTHCYYIVSASKLICKRLNHAKKCWGPADH